MNRRATNEALREITHDLSLNNLPPREALSRLRGMNPQDVESRLAARNVTRKELDSHLNNHAQKGFFREYVVSLQSSKDWGGIPVISHLGALVGSGVGTAWKLATLKPIEGAFAKMGLPKIGKVARWAAVLAAAYFGAPYLFDAVANVEGNAAGPGTDWLSRRADSLRHLINGAPPGLTPDTGAAGYNVPPNAM